MNWLTENWPVLGGFAAGVAAWARTSTNAAGAKSSAAKAHERIDGVKEDIGEIKTLLASVKATAEAHADYTQQGIKEIKDALRSRV